MTFFFFNDTATTEIYTLSLHDALPILQNKTGKNAGLRSVWFNGKRHDRQTGRLDEYVKPQFQKRSEEHTSELQSPCNIVCRLLLEKKKRYTPSRIVRIAKHSA